MTLCACDGLRDRAVVTGREGTILEALNGRRNLIQEWADTLKAGKVSTRKGSKMAVCCSRKSRYANRQTINGNEEGSGGP
ncbi:Hypothetical predicted protein [Pelobates cultripes]|uniref:Uncharacterized protein n=1 Tax=Pelobates cultripes TaxID=61616 RepID=A0AAD1T515_PELCU|nr:Hypothetical predicted protein [Pelobates cultripes]